MSASPIAAASTAQARATRRAIFVLIALTVLLRVPGLGRPLLGDFATKNVVYAMIARNWALGRAELLTPSLDCLAAGERAWHLLEFPVAAYVTACCWCVCGGSLEVWGRALSIVASVASVLLLYLLARRWHGETVARGAAALLALAPVSIIYGQSFMLEASVVALSLGTLYAIERWCERERAGWLALGALLFAWLLLTKIYMLVLLLPLGWLLHSRLVDRRMRWQSLMAGAALLLASVPAIVWCGYASALADPAGATADRVFYSIRDSAANHVIGHPLLGEPGFYVQVIRNLATVVLTPIGAVLFVAGYWNPQWRRHLTWLASGAILLVLLPRKFHEMNYYYLVILPALCIVAGLGWELVTRHYGSRRLLAAVATIGILFSLRYTVRPAFVTPAEDAMVLTAAERVQAWSPSQSPVVTMHGSTIDLLYYCGRPGWAIAPETPELSARLELCAAQGAGLLVVAQQEFDALPRETQQALAQQLLLEEGSGYRIYRLTAAPPAVATVGANVLPIR